MPGFVLHKKLSLAGGKSPHNHVAEIYSVCADAFLGIFPGMVFNSPLEVAAFGMSDIDDRPVFVAELIYTRLSGYLMHGLGIAETFPGICYRHG